MNRNQYRARFVSQEKTLNPERKIWKAYAKRIMQPRGYSLLENIRIEIAPKLASLNLLEENDGFDNSRFSSYIAKGKAGKVQKIAGRGNYSPYSMGSQDSTDLAAENSFAHSLAGAVEEKGEK